MLDDINAPLKPPIKLPAPNRGFRGHEHFNSTTFEEDVGVVGEGQEPAIRWEITLPDLLELASMSTNCRAVIDAWRGNKKVGQIKLEYTDDYNSFEMTFVAQSDFTSLRVLSLISQTWVVVIRTATEQRIVLIDSTTHKVIGGPDNTADRLDVTVKPANQVKSGLEGIRDGVEALANSPQLLFQEKDADAKQSCNNQRKRGWVVAVGTAVGIALAIPTGGSSLVAIAGFAAAGAVGGAQAAQADADAKKCMEEADKKKQPD